MVHDIYDIASRKQLKIMASNIEQQTQNYKTPCKTTALKIALIVRCHRNPLAYPYWVSECLWACAAVLGRSKRTPVLVSMQVLKSFSILKPQLPANLIRWKINFILEYASNHCIRCFHDSVARVASMVVGGWRSVKRGVASRETFTFTFDTPGIAW